MSRWDAFTDHEIYVLNAIFDVAIDDPDPLLESWRERLRALMQECQVEQLRRDGELPDSEAPAAPRHHPR